MYAISRSLIKAHLHLSKIYLFHGASSFNKYKDSTILAKYQFSLYKTIFTNRRNKLQCANQGEKTSHIFLL